MIIDKFKNINLYSGLSEGINKAINFLQQTDFSNFKPGRVEIDNDNIFALLNKYQTKNPDDCKLEAHKKYIDIQYILSGSELIGYAPLNNQTVIEKYSEEKDVAFFEGETSLMKLDEGMFAIFFPDDLHKPCVKSNTIPETVQKIVVKIVI